MLLLICLFFTFGCTDTIGNKPERLAFVKPLTAAQSAEMQAKGKSGLCLEFMLIDSLGNPTASDGKVTVRVLRGGRAHNFAIKQTDFRRKVYAPEGAAYAAEKWVSNPMSCLVGPLPIPRSSVKIMFEFERPDGQLFRREVHL